MPTDTLSDAILVTLAVGLFAADVYLAKELINQFRENYNRPRNARHDEPSSSSKETKLHRSESARQFDEKMSDKVDISLIVAAVVTVAASAFYILMGQRVLTAPAHSAEAKAFEQDLKDIRNGKKK